MTYRDGSVTLYPKHHYMDEERYWAQLSEARDEMLARCKALEELLPTAVKLAREAYEEWQTLWKAEHPDHEDWPFSYSPDEFVDLLESLQALNARETKRRAGPKPLCRGGAK